MTTTYFTSDLHIGHRFVAGLRGFTPEEHDDAIATYWNETVTKWDTVWILGDLTLSNPARVVPFVKSLKGTKHFISGNHDPIHPMHRGWQKRFPIYMEMFESVSPFGTMKLPNGTRALLSHFPYDHDRYEVRFKEYRLRDEGMWLLHGHTHSDEIFGPHPREIHVGVDAWGMSPVNANTIAALIDKRESDELNREASDESAA